MRKLLALVLLVALGGLTGLPAHADGTETLGEPSIAIAQGSGTASGGVGLRDSQPRTMDVEVPLGATVKQVLLYWEGQALEPSPGDDTIVIEGHEVTGQTIGGPTRFFQRTLTTWVSSVSFRADITHLGLVHDGPNTLSVGGLSFNFRNNGAGILVIYDDGTGLSDIQIRDGIDLAFQGFAEPRKSTVPQTFTFEPSPTARTVPLTLMVSSVEPNRGNTVVITVDGVQTRIEQPFGDLQGPEWDTKVFPVDVPPGATTLTVEIVSEGENRASIAWVHASLVVKGKPACPPVPDVSPGTRGMAYALDADLLGKQLIDEKPRAASNLPGGKAHDARSLGTLSVPSVATVTLPTVRSSSTLTPAPVTTATSTILGVNLLSGAIKAEAVDAVSQSVASPDGATYSSAGSKIAGLTINGKKIVNVAPNTTVDVKNPLLPTQTLARAVLYEETGDSSFGSGKSAAKHQVNMIHVTLLKPFLTLPAGAEIIVAHAESSAVSPADECPSTKQVSGRAFTAFAQGRLGKDETPIATVQVGDASLPPTGGADETQTLLVAIPPAVVAAAGHDTTSGSLNPHPNATARSVVTSASLLNGLVRARALDVQSSSAADGTNAGTTFKTTFLDLVVAGKSIGGTPDPNTTIAIPRPDGELLLVVLNEQVTNSNGTTDTEGTVNAIHAYVFNNSGVLEGEVIVASAHSDAHF